MTVTNIRPAPRAGALAILNALVLLCIGLAQPAHGGELLVAPRPNLIPTQFGGVDDRSLGWQLFSLGEDRSYLRNGADGASFQYVLRGQVSADSTFGSGADRAWLQGTMNFDFDLPTALWDFGVSARFSGVVASNASTSSASSTVALSTGGSVGGIAASLHSTGSVVDGVANLRASPTRGGELDNRLPGGGSVSAFVDVRADSEGGVFTNGGEALVTFGRHSALSGFTLDGHFHSGDGLFITLVFRPHFEMSGQTLNGDVSLVAGEVINGRGTIRGQVTSAPGSLIRASQSLALGNGAAPVVVGGALEVSASGTLLLDGPARLAAGSETTLLSPTSRLRAPDGLQVDGALRGQGTVEADVVVNGLLAPGNSPGFLDIAGDLALQPDAQLAIELAGLSAYDSLRVSGLATLGGMLEVALIDGFALDHAQAFEIIDAAFLAGEFLGLGEGAAVGNYGGLDLFITYRGGDGNDVFLFTAAAIPEPQTWLLLLAGLGLLASVVRRERRGRAAQKTGTYPI